MTGRHLSSQLPVVNQTAAIVKFFGATVDQVFQPGTAEQINGYIGELAAYNNIITDFYINEPTDSRGFYQLEPGMVTYNTAGTLTQALTYPDLISYLAAEGGVTADNSRLFDTEFYTWAPPIDIEKLTNYQQYSWFGDETGPDDLPILTISSPVNSYIGDGVTISFAMPLAIAGIASSQETPGAYVDDLPVPFAVSPDGKSLLLAAAPAVGTVVLTTRLADLAHAMSGQVTFPLTGMVSHMNTYYGDGVTTSFAIYPLTMPAGANSTIVVFVNQQAVKFTIANGTVIIAAVPSAGNNETAPDRIDVVTLVGLRAATYDGVAYPTDVAIIAVPLLSSTMRVRLLDESALSGIGAWDISPWETWPWDNDNSNVYFVDGVGQSIRLTPDTSMIRGFAAQYVTVDRSSQDVNEWSIRNNWVHHDTYAWSGQQFASRQATRPIIEFIRDIALYNYGYIRLPAVDCLLTGAQAILAGTGPISVSAINGKPSGLVSVDNGVVLVDGMRLLVAQTSPDTPSMNNQIYLVTSAGSYTGWDDGTFDLPSIWDAADDTITLVPQPPTQTGDIVAAMPPTGYLIADGWDAVSWEEIPAWDATSFAMTVQATGLGASAELWFNGTSWVPAQAWNESVDPLFMLYDIEPVGVALSDPTRYPGSDFAGNRIFGYAPGTGMVPDPVLQRTVTYDQNGYIVFENDAVVVMYNCNNGPLTGLYCYGIYGVREFATSSLWRRGAGLAQQVVTILDYDTPNLYEIPSNLQANPLCDDVTFLSRSEWSTHFNNLMQDQIGFAGSLFGGNNWRDGARDLTLGTEILQHRTALLKTMLLASNSAFDYPNAVRYADQEYTRTRNQFSRKLVDLSNRGVVLDTQPPSDWIAAAFSSLTLAKTAGSPFALSTMGGANYFIPPTPTFLGVLPACLPGKVIDTTYASPVRMIRGHDGSLTPAFGDWRDDVFLALEMAIYNNIPSHLAGNFDPEARPDFDLAAWRGGRFQQNANGYTLGEINRMLAPSFLLWAEIGHYDYRTNTGYDQGNPFTWNFHGVPDRQGNLLPGNWRAIYRWYYDTDHPHTAPWEMLGFTDEPSWWADQYTTSWSAINVKLWSDLELGLIRQGTHAGIDPRYARPGLSAVIPVDANGNLLDPLAAHIVPRAPVYQQASAPWMPGDHGPAENIWINTPAYRFALAQIAFLMKPVRLVDTNWNNYVLNTLTGSYYNKVGWMGDQWIDFITYNRPSNASDYIHGEIQTDGTRAVVAGIQQWLSDSLIHAGQSPSVLGNAVRGIGVRLIHQMASFISADSISAVADSFGLLPAEDTSIILYNSPVTDTEVYSGVIIEWTGQGYRVVGYDNKNPFFTVIPPNIYSPRGVISLATTPEPVITLWHSNVYYQMGSLATYQGSNYECTRSHTSGNIFEVSYWTLYGVASTPAPRIVTYLTGKPITVSYAYGTVFTSLQQVGDFLLGWERWLVSRGWTFTSINPTTGTVLDWSSAAFEFLVWSQAPWASGSFISLSPGAAQLNFSSATGTVLNVEDAFTGFFGLLDRSGHPIGSRAASVTRLDGNVTIEASNADIYCARLDISDVEHALVFANVSIFNDVIYLPLYNMRQARLRLIGNRTRNWTGRLDAPGYLLVGSQLVPSFDKNVEDVRLAFDIEQSDRMVFRDHARHVIGYQARSYMKDMLLSDTQQFEFYQGMIQAKGSPGVFDKLLRSQRVNADSNIAFLEEWAFRLSRFGVPLNPRLTMMLQQINVMRDPQVIKFSQIANSPDDWIVIPPGDQRWLDTPTKRYPFPVREDNLPLAVPTAGPVRINDVQVTSFLPSDLAGYHSMAYAAGLSPFQTMDRVWIYCNAVNTWDVWRVFELGTQPNTVTQVITQAEITSGAYTDATPLNGVRVYFAKPMGLTQADVGNMVVFDGLTYSMADLIGVQTIITINTAGNWIEVDADSIQGYSFIINTKTTAPHARIFRSVRFPLIGTLDASPNIWSTGDLVWVDDDGTGRWTVLSWQNSLWTPVRNQPDHMAPDAIVTSMAYAVGATISGNKMFSDQPVINDLTLIDPLAGAFPGVAAREIDYRLDYDPAAYNGGYGGTSPQTSWGQTQVGRVWWNMSTVRYLDPYTDILGASATRDIAEINYRSINWAQIAPNTSIDIYEWVQSDVSPADWTAVQTSDTTGAYTGTVYQANTPSWVEETIYNIALGKERTVYYFWVSGRTTIPTGVPFRRTAIATVANLLTNPSFSDTPWIAPFIPDGLLVSGIAQFLNDTDTALTIEISTGIEGNGHDEWVLLRQNDATAVPPDWLWRHFRDSLAGFNDKMELVPDPSLSVLRNTGIFPGQGLFSVANTYSANGGLLNARRNFVGIVNQILATDTVVFTRAAGVATLARSEPIQQDLCWFRPDQSYCLEPPPKVFDVTVHSVQERDRLIVTPLFQEAIQNATTSAAPALQVLIDGTNTTKPFWSIWKFNAQLALQTAIDNSNNLETLIENAGQLFTLAHAYDITVDNYTDRNLQATSYTVGARVFVQSDETANGFWTIYTYLPDSDQADAYGFVLYRVQAYDTTDFYRTADWYAQNISISGNTVSYSAANSPIVQYPNTATRDRIEGVSPSNLFVLITNPSGGGWLWTAYDSTIAVNGVPNGWTIVARQNATIALSNNFYKTSLVPHNTQLIPDNYGAENDGFDVGGYDESITPDLNIATRDGAWEMRVLVQTLLHGGLLEGIELNEILFNLVTFVHTQQNDVDWAFKTSFMTVAGYAVPLTQSGIQTTGDLATDLTDYVNEIKPYHVKIRDYEEQYSAGIDIAPVHATDFDNPSYFDPGIGKYRALDIANLTDQTILQVQNPWLDWYSVYNSPISPVRHIKTTLKFDRVTGQVQSGGFAGSSLDQGGFDNSYETGIGTIIDRIGQYYDGGQPVQDLLGLDFKGTIVDGQGLLRDTPPQLFTVSVGATTQTITLPTGYAYLSGSVLVPKNDGYFWSLSIVLGAASTGNIIAALYDNSGPAGSPGALVIASVPVANAAAGPVEFAFAAPIPVIGGKTYYWAFISDADVVVTGGAGSTGSLQIGQDYINDLPASFVYGSPTATYANWNASFSLSLSNVTLPITVDINPDGTGPVWPVDMNAISTNDPLGYGLRDPFVVSGHPEERAIVVADDGLRITVSSGGLAGSPPQIAKVFKTGKIRTVKATLFFDLIPADINAVMVWRDGLRAINGTDYTVDQFARTVTVKLMIGSVKVKTVIVHVFGFGGAAPMLDWRFITSDGTTPTIGFSDNLFVDSEFDLFGFDTEGLDITSNIAIAPNNVAVLVNGQAVDSASVTVSGRSATLGTRPSPGDDVALLVYEGSADLACQTNVETISYTPSMVTRLMPQMKPLGWYPAGGNPAAWSVATSCSADGSIITGSSNDGNGNQYAVIIKGAGGIWSAISFPTGWRTTLQAATAISADGSAVAGYAPYSGGTTVLAVPVQQAFLWTAAKGVIGLGFVNGHSSGSQASGISANGNSVAATCVSSGGQSIACLWTAASGMVGLGIPSGTVGTTTTGISGDGTVVIGTILFGANPYSVTETHAFYWTARTGIVDLGALIGGSFAQPTAVSHDGTVIAGNSNGVGFTYGEAWRWTAVTGMQPLGRLGSGRHSSVWGMSSDGTSIFGDAQNTFRDGPVAIGQDSAPTDTTVWDTGAAALPTTYAVSWTGGNGFVPLGTGFPPGYTQGSAKACSSDGSVIVGGTGIPGEAFVCTWSNATVNSTQQWTLNKPDTQTVPEHAGTIVEVNGLRLVPPLTFYGKFDATHQFMTMGVFPTRETRMRLYINSAELLTRIPNATRGLSSLPYGIVLPPGTPSGVLFAIVDDTLFSLNPLFVGEVCLTMYCHHDYEVNNGELTILTPLTGTNTITVTTFANAEIMGMRTYTLPFNANGDYVMPGVVHGNYCLVTRNGTALALDIDYQLTNAHRLYDQTGFDQIPVTDILSDEQPITRVFLTAPANPNIVSSAETVNGVTVQAYEWLVATVFTGAVARQPAEWMVTTVTPSAARMVPTTVNTGGLGAVVPDIVYKMDNTWEQNSVVFAGALHGDLHVNDTFAVIDISAVTTSPKFWRECPVPMPDRKADRPAVIWIGGERIEYWTLQWTDNLVTIGNLRRGTRGTSVSREQRTVRSRTGDGTTVTYHVAAVGVIVDVFVDGARQWETVDFAAATSNGQTSITFAKAPVSGAIIRIGISSGIMLQPQGTPVICSRGKTRALQGAG